MHEELIGMCLFHPLVGMAGRPLDTQSEGGAWGCQHIGSIQSHDSGEELPGLSGAGPPARGGRDILRFTFCSLWEMPLTTAECT